MDKKKKIPAGYVRGKDGKLKKKRLAVKKPTSSLTPTELARVEEILAEKEPRLLASTKRPPPPPPPQQKARFVGPRRKPPPPPPARPKARLLASTVRPPPPPPPVQKKKKEKQKRRPKRLVIIDPKPPAREVVKMELPDDVLKQISAFSKPTGKGKRVKPSSWTFDIWETYYDDYLRSSERFYEWADDMFNDWFSMRYDEDDYLNEDGDHDIDFIDEIRHKWDDELMNDMLHFLVWTKGMMTGPGGDLHNKRRKKDTKSKVAKVPMKTVLDGKTESELEDIIIKELP